jgi:low temperature requirement protein LtrA
MNESNLQRSGLTSRILGSVSASSTDHKVTQFELFFDLVFVFAFTRVTELMAHEHDVTGVVRGFAVLGVLWWSWAPYTWLANQVRMDRGVMRIGLGITTAAVFLIGVTIPDAFPEADVSRTPVALLILGYLVVRLVHVTLYLLAAAEDPALRRQVVLTNVVSLPPVFVLLAVGAWIAGDVQTWFWIAAWFVDFAVVIATAWRGGAWHLHAPAHWAERYGLIVILAIGESIVSIGAGLREVHGVLPTLGASVLAIAGAVLIWWFYFDGFAEGAEHGIARREGGSRVRVANLAYNDLHFLIVGGIVLVALGIETITARITEGQALGAFGAVTFWSGMALFFTATIAIWRVTTGRWLIARVIVVTTLYPVIVLCAALPALAGLAIAVALGVVLIVVERVIPSIGPSAAPAAPAVINRKGR